MCLQHSMDGVLWTSEWCCGGHSLKTCCLWAWSCPSLFKSGELSLAIQPEASELKQFALNRRSGKRHRVRAHGGNPGLPFGSWALQTVFVEISASKYGPTPKAVVNPLWQDEKMSRQKNLSHVCFTFNCPSSSITDLLRGVFTVSHHSFAIRHLRLNSLLSVSLKGFLKQELN